MEKTLLPVRGRLVPILRATAGELLAATCRMLRGRSRRFGLVAPILFAGLFLSASPAMATIISCTNPVPGSYTFTLPSGTYALPRDLSSNTLVVPWSDWYVGGEAVWQCNNTGTGGGYDGAATWMQGLTETGQMYADGGTTFPIFATNVPGIGMVVGGSSKGPSGWHSDLGGRPYGISVTSYPKRQGAWLGGGTNAFGFRIRVAFVTLGRPSAGTVAFAGAVGTTGMGTTQPSPDNVFQYGPAQTAPITLVGGPTFVLLSCETPDVSVDLRQHQLSSFTGPATTTPAVDFSVKLNNCPAGMNAIKYRIDPATTVVDATQSVVALDATSTATGIGVQLLNGAGTPHPLGTGTDQLIPAYSPTTGGSYTIPLKARYYQTDPSVTPGLANTLMTFTLTYQ
ncbi:MAG TPA: fimbrial protein [Lysobacter sp.]